jgi:hypothetical protein
MMGRAHRKAFRGWSGSVLGGHGDDRCTDAHLHARVGRRQAMNGLPAVDPETKTCGTPAVSGSVRGSGSC